MTKRRCFIEVDTEVDEWTMQCVLEDTGVRFGDLFNTVIVDAAGRGAEVWKAVCEHDEIWIETNFRGDSNDLLTEMLLLVDGSVRDKKIVNLFSSDWWQLNTPQVETLVAIERDFNIRLISAGSTQYNFLMNNIRSAGMETIDR